MRLSSSCRTTLISIMLILATLARSEAATECSAECSCWCDPSWNAGCSMFCAPGYTASCLDGFCDGPAARCCCYVAFLGRPSIFAADCWNEDCGQAPPTQCASLKPDWLGRLGLNVPARGLAPRESSSCRALLHPGSTEKWYYAEVRSDATGELQALDIRFTSEPVEKADLELCLTQERNSQEKGLDGPHPAVERTFRYIPQSGMERTRGGRRLHLSLPELAPVNADLAVRVEMSRDGSVLEKSLLFSSDPEVGLSILDQLDSSLTVEVTGEGPGPFTDVLLLKLVNGTMVVFGQNHYSRTVGLTT
jgi:hypothetical protein